MSDKNPPRTGRKKPRQSAVSAAEFRAMRKAVGFSQAKFAALTGVAPSSLANYELGRRPVPRWAVFILRVLLAKRQALITGQRPTLDID